MSEQEHKPTQRKNKGISFLITTTIGILTTIPLGIATLISYYRPDVFNKIQFPTLPLVSWIFLWVLIYCLISLWIEKKYKGSFINKIFRIPVWTELRGFGDDRVSRISYFGLIIIPIIAYLYKTDIVGFNLSEAINFPQNIKLIYFASCFFSLALILFTIACPSKIRKYKKIEKARNVNILLNNSDKSRVLVEDNEEEFPNLESLSLGARMTCFTLFLTGIALTIIVLIRGAILVYEM
ncbi:hypothetical protein Q4Q35_13765 [Flavivirga aquimarina]|uniref:Uncharacterized protein n=1 Tax=Flavivirga aquimarina TaxID=2027862 RepID=A0ABT8WCM8_9FLAO|nr:hypothetical protein [Flavivirga aquimarina]MDO5970875.1 hypothetical protein [Flavivirga aquimarina]